MLLKIQHETHYKYENPVRYSIQRLLLTPRQEGAQHTRQWSIHSSGQRSQGLDAFGNISHMIVVDRPHDEVSLVVNGVVDSDPSPRITDYGTLPVQCYLQETSLTQSNSDLVALAETITGLPSAVQFADETSAEFIAAMVQLMTLIEERIQYIPGTTTTTTTAAEALQNGSGVCQDHAQVFVTCARILGLPARYVSGYLYTGDNQHLASHAWADVWDGCSWLSCDTTHKRLTDANYCRLAVGRDYLDACPVRGVRRGGGAEELLAHVLVNQSGQ